MESHFGIGQYFKNLRSQQGDTLHQVAKGTDIDMTMLSKIERDERLPTAEQSKRLALFFKLPEREVLAKITAEKIIKDYGMNETTLEAIKMVGEQIAQCIKTNRK